MSEPSRRTPSDPPGRNPRVRVPGRHRAADRPPPPHLRPGLLWPLAALVVVALAAARTLRSAPLPADGDLAVPAAALLRGTGGAAPLSPEGVGAAHTAVYATVTRAFERHQTLVGAERELLAVLVLVSAVLLWRTARRLDVPDAACALAVLLFGGVGLVVPLHDAATPAAFAVCWLLLAGWALAGEQPPVPLRVLAAGAAAIAVLLAPDTLLLLAAGVAVAAVLRPGPGRLRVVGALLGVLALGAVRLLVGRWDPQSGGPGRWGGSSTELLLVSAVLVAVAAAAAWRLPRFRPAGVALGVTTLLAVAPPSGRLPALLLCLPVGALLAGALAAAVTGRTAPAPDRPRARVAAVLVAALVLAGLATAAVAAPTAGGRPPNGPAELAAWAGEQLPGGTVLLASPLLSAELVHAGADPGRFDRDEAADAASPVLQVTGAPPTGAGLVARFGDLAVVDPDPAEPTPEQVAARRQLAAALLAAPATDLPADDAAALAAGQVDPRLLVLLAGVTARLGVGLRGLPAVAGEPAGALRRQAVVAPGGDPAGVERLRSYLAAQQPPYRPDRVTGVEGGLLLGHHLVRDPDGLVALPGGR